MKQLALGVGLRSAAVFHHFCVGPNAEAVAAVRDSATGPLWLWGGAATGKTHLLQAACADNAGRSAYLPLGADAGLPPDALEGYERMTLLCLDDLDAVAGRIEWERALFNLWNAVLESGARLLLAARHAPTAIDWVLPDWASRAASSAVYQLRVLDDEQRIEALRMRAQSRGLELPVETAEYLLRRMPRDQQVLFDLVDALDDAALVAQRRLTVPFVRKTLNLS